jgi:hypothetical protein
MAGDDERWSLSPCDIKPGSLPFAVDVIPPIRECLDRDSIDHLLPGAYLILKDGWNCLS